MPPKRKDYYFNLKEIQELKERVFKIVSSSSMDFYWERAYLSLLDALDRLEAKQKNIEREK